MNQKPNSNKTAANVASGGAPSPRSRFIGNGIVVSGGTALAYGLRFVRNVVLAHLLSQGDFGVCVAMTSLLASAQLLTNFGFEKLLIQERRIDDRELQPVLASLVAMRMGIAALFLFATAGLMARLLGVPEATNAFRVLALSLIPMGFLHLDTTRFQKHYRYGPDSIISITYPLLDILLTTAAVYTFRTYQVIPYTLVVSALGTMLLSMAMAERPFQMSWDKAIVKHALRFSLPLIPDGFIILAAGQADRLVIGAELGVVSLAIYGATMTMLSSPAVLLARIETLLFLPRLAEVGLDPERFRKRYMQIGIATTVIPVFALVPLLVFGQELVSLFFSARYHPPAALVWVVALGQAVGLIRLWSNMGAMARGDTKNVLLSNVYRVSGIFLAIAAVKMHLGLVVIAATFSIGEFFGLVGAFGHLLNKNRDLVRGTSTQLLMAGLVFAGAVVATEVFAGSLLFKFLSTVVLLACYSVAVTRSTKDGRVLLSEMWVQISGLVANLKKRSAV